MKKTLTSGFYLISNVFGVVRQWCDPALEGNPYLTDDSNDTKVVYSTKKEVAEKSFLWFPRRRFGLR